MKAISEPVGAGPSPASLDDLQRTVSASRLNTWLSCRLRFYFKYVLGLTKPRTASLYVGHTVHGVLKLWNKARWRKEVLTPDQLKEQFENLWQQDQVKEGIRWQEDEEPGEKQTAWSLLDLYFKETPIPHNERPEGVEVSVEADLSKHGLPRLIGILDLVRSGGRIADYKTVGQTPNPEKAIHANELQLSGYAVLYREATGRKEGGLELHQLVKLKNPKLILTTMEPMTDQQQTRLFKQMESYVEGVGRRDFVPSPGMQCSACSFFNECRRWS
jgi:putative RecB family exonuclease